MKLQEAEKNAVLVTRPIKMTEKVGNKILGRFVEVKTIERPADAMGDSRVLVLQLEDTNMDLAEDQGEHGDNVQVYMSGQLDYLIAQTCGKMSPDKESPMLLITYTGLSKGVETEYGKKDIHRFTVSIVNED